MSSVACEGLRVALREVDAQPSAATVDAYTALPISDSGRRRVHGDDHRDQRHPGQSEGLMKDAN
jgi:hypothetical protein